MARPGCPDFVLDDEKTSHDDVKLIHGNLKTFDVGLALAAQDQLEEGDVSAGESARLCRKIDWHLLPLLCFVYTRLIADNRLTTSEFNTLSSAFYIGYLVFEWPQNWALQRLPVGKWLTFNIFLWSVFIGLQSLCHNFGGLFILRFLLGAAEGCTTAGLMLVCSMFYTRLEIAERLGWTFQCNGFATIISGFIQFGMAHVPPQNHPNQWQWLMIAIALLTLINALLFLLFFPDNPTKAWFLSPTERVKAVQRLRNNQNGIETKTWKWYQMREALYESRTWVYFLFAGFCALVGGIGVQYSLLIKSFGFSELQSTLLGIPGGAAQVIAITTACYLARRFPNMRAWISIMSWIPSIVACLIEICVPLENRVAHLVGIYLLFTGGSPAFILTMSWVTSNTSGHTKKLATTAIFLVGYALGQTLCTQFWLDKYKPADRVPFGITLMSHLASIVCTLALWASFKKENARRDTLKLHAERTGVDIAAHEEYAYVDVTDSRNKECKQRVDKMYLDLTDRENLAFRYIL
ncbi:hypothetical protein EIP86_009614 [Pleurotus ostreatoroseus]|nr:hypothetical protein EIP86_009614 [Pleurotus ostreatoroseus]